MRTTRFRGDPLDLPDVGDVLAAHSQMTGEPTGTRYVVMAARRTRGHDPLSGRITMSIARDDTAEPAEGSRLFPLWWDRR